MKNKAVLFFACSFLLLSVSASAQTVRFGVKAGAGIAQMSYTPTPPPDTFQYDYYTGFLYDRQAGHKPTFTAGGLAEYDLAKNWLLSGGLQACLKFYEANDDRDYPKDRFRMNVVYLQVPLMAHFRTGKWFVGIGGYAGAGLSGRWNRSLTFYNDKTGEEVESISDAIKFGTDFGESNWRRFDGGARGEVGFGLKKMRLSVAYEHGFANSLNSGTNANQQFFDSKLRHRAVTAAVAYYWLAK
jgi:hypothetical protein